MLVEEPLWFGHKKGSNIHAYLLLRRSFASAPAPSQAHWFTDFPLELRRIVIQIRISVLIVGIAGHVLRNFVLLLEGH